MEEAAAWSARLSSPSVPEGAWREFQAWLEASPDHVAAMDQVEELEGFVALHAVSLDADVAPVQRRSRAVFLSRVGMVSLAAAAGVAIVLWLAPRMTRPDEATYSTRPGETRLVQLEDGTRVRLNADTALTVQMTRARRLASLSRGEAALEVAHSAERPFVVTVADATITVVGTAFDVRERNGVLRVTVARGIVRVEPLAAKAGWRRELTAGQELTHQSGEPEVRWRVVDAANAFAWAHGQLVCEDRRLDEIAADLSASLGEPVRVDPKIGSLRFSGVLTLTDPAVLARRLEAYLPVRAEITKEGIFLRPASSSGSLRSDHPGASPG